MIVVIAQWSDPGDAVDVLLLTPAVLAFALRALLPRMPAEVFAVLVIVPVAAAVGHDGALEGAFFLSVTMVLFTASSLESFTRAVVIMVIAAAAPWFVAEHVAPESGITWYPWATAHVFTFLLGRALHKQQTLIGELEQARHALAEQAVAEERRRIARELHDLAGHTLAAVLLHVTGARHVLRRDLDEAERALLEAEAVGRTSLDQIRATVASLRAEERGTDPSLAGSADVVALVEEYRRAGVNVDAVITERVAELHGPVGTAVHRIAREALANVARHAPDNAVELRLSIDGEVHLVVTDRGRPPPPLDANAAHFGLVGMAERARALGGELRAGPTADGWRVETTLPVAPSAVDKAVRVVIRVLIVDDQPVIRAGLARILGADDGFEVVAQCADGDEVVDAVAAHDPDVVLLDIRMRRVDGVTATRRLVEQGSNTPVMVLTTFDDDDALWGALDAGAAGFVLKDAAAEDLIAAVRAVAGGAAWLDPRR